MQAIFGCVAILIFSFQRVHCCRDADWSDSFNTRGFSNCASDSEAIRGFYRSPFLGASVDDIYRIERAVCCPRSSPYGSLSNIVIADWYLTLDGFNVWATCPRGFFLTGLYRTDDQEVPNIEYGRCMKPSEHPHEYGDCYDEDVSESFNDGGTSQCQPDYFVTGFYKGDCNKLNCIESFRCCKMAPAPEVLNSLYRMKTRMMEKTQIPLAILAHYMGYGLASGCRAPFAGEDFMRVGDMWFPDQRGQCVWTFSSYRLSITYAYWSFGVKQITYGPPETQALIPETVGDGMVINDNSSKAAIWTVTLREESVRSVKHTTTSWSNNSQPLAIEIPYNPIEPTDGQVSYMFNYEDSEVTTDSDGKPQKKVLSVSDTKVILPNSSTAVSVKLAKTRTTVAYTAIISTKFLVLFRGFLRYGGGPNSTNTNYHNQHRGSSSKPVINYNFGNLNTTFYEALRTQSNGDVPSPWQWADMKSAYSNAQSIIDFLTSPAQYEFKLTGQFEEVIGQQLGVIWQNRTSILDLGEHVSLDLENHTDIARPLPEDAEVATPSPPEAHVENPPDVQIDRVESNDGV